MKTSINKPTLPQIMHLLTLLGQKDVSSENLQSLIELGVLSDLFEADPKKIDRNVCRQAFGLDPQRMEIMVDYGLTLDQMIEAGRYYRFNNNITAERFPIVGEGIVGYEVKLFYFDRRISSADVEIFIKKEDSSHPWESAKIEHLLAFGATFPDMQRKFLIVGLGSSCKIVSDRYGPILREDNSARRLGLHYWDDWHTYDRFLAVREILDS